MVRTSSVRFAAVAALLCCSSSVNANVVNLGFGWQATAPDGYNVALDEAMGTVRPFPGATAVAIPLKLIVPNWSTTDPVEIKFTGPIVGERDRFMLRMVVGNDTGDAWNGFGFEIRDPQIDYPNTTTGQRGNLVHPDRAHMHTDKILSERLGFEVLDIQQRSYNGRPPMEVLQTRHPGLDEGRGVYTLDLFSGLSDFLVNDQDVWAPLFFDRAHPNDPTRSSLLDFHLHFIGRQANTEFSVILQPHSVPEPGTLLLLGLGSAVLTGYAWRQKIRKKKRCQELFP